MKYIIELNPDCVDGNFLRMPIRLAGEDQWIKTKASLMPYTEPDRKVIEDEVWEFATICTKMDGADSVDVFGGFSPDSFTKFSYQEAKDKYEAWKKRKDKIKVGDEVGNGFVKGTAFYVDETMVEGFFIDDDEEIEHFWWNKRDCKKTDRHFPEVAQLLEKMRGDSDDN